MPTDVEQIDVDDLPDIPECRVLAGWDVAGGMRYELPADYAEDFLEHVRAAREQPRDGFVDIVFILDYPAMVSVTKGLAELHRARENDEVALKQIMVTPDDPDLAVAVFLNESQISSSLEKNYVKLKQHGRGRMYGQEYSISTDGAEMLEQQLEAALDGADDPLDHVDESEVDDA